MKNSLMKELTIKRYFLIFFSYTVDKNGTNSTDMRGEKDKESG